MISPYNKLIISTRQFNFFRIVFGKLWGSFFSNLLNETAGFIEHEHIHLVDLLAEKIYVCTILLRIMHGIGQGQTECSGGRFGLRLGFRFHIDWTVRQVVLDTPRQAACR